MMILDESSARMLARESPRTLIKILRERARPASELFFAAEFAAYGNDPEGVAVLVDVLRTHDSATVREGAAIGLSQTQDATALDALRHAAESDPSRAVRLAAKDALDR